VRSLIPGEGPGRQRLLDTYKEGYDARWAQLQPGFHAQAESARAAMLMAGATLGRTPAAAESKAAAAEGRAAATESRALGAEARALASEGEAVGARATRLVSAESLGLRRALSTEEASALETRLLEWEAESAGRREAFSANELRSGRLSPRPQPSKLATEDALRWNEFEAYRQLRNHFQSCLQFETKVGGLLLRELEHYPDFLAGAGRRPHRWPPHPAPLRPKPGAGFHHRRG